MRRCVAIIILFWIVFSCGQNQKMNFETYTRQLFFNANITKNDSSLLVYYKRLDNLKEIKYDGFTIYPPLSALGLEELPKTYTFQFKSHPKILFDFREGELILDRTNKGPKYFPVLKINFDTKEQAEKAFQTLLNDFKGVATKKRIREKEWGNIAEFTDDNSRSVKEIMIMYSKGDTLNKGYALLIMLTNELESSKE